MIDQYKQIFGIENVEEITSNDPFTDNLDTSDLTEDSLDNDM